MFLSAECADRALRVKARNEKWDKRGEGKSMLIFDVFDIDKRAQEDHYVPSKFVAKCEAHFNCNHTVQDRPQVRDAM